MKREFIGPLTLPYYLYYYFLGRGVGARNFLYLTFLEKER